MEKTFHTVNCSCAGVWSLLWRIFCMESSGEHLARSVISWHTELFGDGFWASRRSQCSKTRSCGLSLIFHKKSGDRFLYDQHNAVDRDCCGVYRGENRSAQMKRNNVFGRRIADSKQIGEPKWAGQSWWFRMSRQGPRLNVLRLNVPQCVKWF